MKSKCLKQLATLGFASAAALGVLFVNQTATGGTPFEEVVIYGIDGDTNQLMRYTFDTDTFHTIGVVTANGSAVENTEGLTWVGSGPAKGMYCVPRDGALSGKMLRINPMDASAEVVFNSLSDDITAMVSFQVGSDWVILAWDYNDDRLLAMDPVTGAGQWLFGASLEIEGLAIGPDGTIYANSDTDLYTVDLVAETFTHVGSTGTNKLESMEYCFGDQDPQIDVAGVPASWTADGVLLGFDDKGDSIEIINPATGETRQFSCSFATVDCEGLVTLTQLTDPYGKIVVEPCD